MICRNWKEINDQYMELVYKNYDILLVGENVNIDDRSSYLYEQFSNTGKNILKFFVKINEQNNKLVINICKNDSDENLQDLEQVMSEYVDHNMLIDMTTFDVPSLSYLIDNINKYVNHFTICYIEPKGYKKKEQPVGGENDVLYHLSEDGNSIEYVLPFIPNIGSKITKYFISLGYESYRLAGFLESDEIEMQAEINVVFGIPAFNLGWENHSIENNYSFLNSLAKELSIYTIPADDPIQIYMKLTEVLRSLKPGNRSIESIVLVPLGTKPQALGMIWFAINNKENVGLIYDFVKKIPNRTQGIKKIHLWGFESKISKKAQISDQLM